MKDAQRSARARIVLVHGGFVDGSGWLGVYEILRRDGYEVAIVQNPAVRDAVNDDFVDGEASVGGVAAIVQKAADAARFGHDARR